MSGKGWRRGGWAGLLLAGWLLLLAAGRAWAQPAGPEMTVSMAWDGLMRKPGWVELQITLENESGDWTGEVVVEERQWTTTYRLPVQLPAHAHKVYRLPIFLDGSDSAEIALLDERGKEVEHHPLSLREVSFDARICIAADPLTTLKLEACDETLVLPQPEGMPEMASAWDAIDLLVMRDFPTAEMSEAQRAALRAWVAAGGHLVLLEGPAMEAMLEGLPPSLRPSCESPTLVQRPDGSALTVCRRTVGLGKVDRPRQDDPAELEVLWDTEPVPAVIFPFADAESGLTISTFFPSANWLFQVPRSIFPTPYALPILALVYFFLLIPLPYLITRRLQRPMLTWLLIPAIVLITSLCLFLWLSGFASDSFPITHEMTFAFVPDADEPARLFSFGATLAPRTRHLEWEVPTWARTGRGYFGQDGGGPWMDHGDPYAMTIHLGEERARLETDAPRGILTWGWAGLAEVPPLTMEGRMTGSTYDLHVESPTPVRLQALVLYGEYILPLHNEVVSIGALNATSFFTELETLPYYPYNSSLSPCAYALVTAVPSPFSGLSLSERPRRSAPGCYLIVDRPEKVKGAALPSTEIEGKMVHEDCYLYRVSCPRSEEGALLPVMPSDIVVVEGDGWVSPSPPPATYYSNGTSEVVLSFHAFDLGLSSEIRGIMMTLEPYSGDMPFVTPSPTSLSAWDQIDRVAVWNWEERRWVEVEKPAQGESLEITPAKPFIDTDGEVRILLEGSPLPTMHVSFAVRLGGE